MPKAVSITGRISSITNSFVNSIIPVIHPTTSQINEALSILQMIPEDVQCAYCGDKATEWDHLRPLVVDQKPTGYISEIGNLVPSCGKCNQSKGNKNWFEWMTSNAPQSPKVRRVPDITRRMECLKLYENWHPIKLYKFPDIAGEELWNDYIENWKNLLWEMQKSQKIANTIRERVKQHVDSEGD